MLAESTLYRDLAYVFVAAVLGGFVAWRLRQPLIIGYVLGGIAVGPFTPGPTVSDVHTLELLAEIGVILLMYSIGIEFSIQDLLEVKWVSLIGGPLGLVAVILLTLALGRLLGWSTTESIVIGASVSLASTMVLSRLLIDRGELHSQHGRAMIGITLVDDLAFVIMIVLLPSLEHSYPEPILEHWLRLWKGLADPSANCVHHGQGSPLGDGARVASGKSRASGSGFPGSRIYDRGCDASSRTIPRSGSILGWNGCQ